MVKFYAPLRGSKLAIGIVNGEYKGGFGPPHNPSGSRTVSIVQRLYNSKGDDMKRISKIEVRKECERMISELQHEIVRDDMRGIDLKFQVARIRALKDQMILLG